MPNTRGRIGVEYPMKRVRRGQEEGKNGEDTPYEVPSVDIE